MKIVVIGGSGLIGSKLVTKLRERGHESLAASPKSGVNTLTGEGLATALEGASVVADVSNAPSFDDSAVLEFFETSTRNLLTAESAAGVRHHVALSVVGTERLSESGQPAGGGGRPRTSRGVAVRSGRCAALRRRPPRPSRRGRGPGRQPGPVHRDGR
jgi:nucleoside-diphosphate-sugar epimerase